MDYSSTNDLSLQPLVEVADVTCVFPAEQGDAVPLREVSFALRAGDFLAVLGPSGSGKSVLVSVLCGFLRPTMGDVRIGDHSLRGTSNKDLPAWRARHVGLVTAEPHLFPELTARENVALPLRLLHLKERRRQSLTQIAMEAVGVTELADRRPRELSALQTARVALARAVVLAPDLLLADEPCGRLDGPSTLSFMDSLSALNLERNQTILLTTHDAAVAQRATRILELDKNYPTRRGRIVRSAGELPAAQMRRMPEELPAVRKTMLVVPPTAAQDDDEF